MLGEVSWAWVVRGSVLGFCPVAIKSSRSIYDVGDRLADSGVVAIGSGDVVEYDIWKDPVCFGRESSLVAFGMSCMKFLFWCKFCSCTRLEGAEVKYWALLSWFSCFLLLVWVWRFSSNLYSPMYFPLSHGPKFSLGLLPLDSPESSMGHADSMWDIKPHL